MTQTAIEARIAAAKKRSAHSMAEYHDLQTKFKNKQKTLRHAEVAELNADRWEHSASVQRNRLAELRAAKVHAHSVAIVSKAQAIGVAKMAKFRAELEAQNALFAVAARVGVRRSDTRRLVNVYGYAGATRRLQAEGASAIWNVLSEVVPENDAIASPADTAA